MSTAPLIAIVGRPNVGKSTLFNRLTHRWQSIVEDEPGITRDRLEGTFFAFGQELRLMDTGGLNFSPKTLIEKKMSAQAMMGVEEADLIVFMMDGRAGLHPTDKDWADKIRRLSKPVLHIVNKIDNDRLENNVADFAELGTDLLTVSAEKKRNLIELARQILVKLNLPVDPKAEALLVNPHKKNKVISATKDLGPDLPEEGEILEDKADQVLKVAIIGRPNVGKSTLLNSILGEERCVVDDTPGTTRDPVHTDFSLSGKNYRLIDTAGIRRHAKTKTRVEKFSVMSALNIIDQAHMVLLLIDGNEGPTDQDAHVAGYAFEKSKAIIVVVNKWDLGHEKFKVPQFTERLELKMNYLNYCPVLYVSAKTKKNLRKIFDTIETMRSQYFYRIKTGELNRAFAEIIDHHPLPSFNGRDIRMKYVTQVGTAPPTFAVFCTDPAHVHFSYKRYLSNALREGFKLKEVPLRVVFKGQ